MKSFSTTRLAYRQARAGVRCHLLLWIRAKNRATGAEETIGLWDGIDHEVFSINSVVRTYYAAGNILRVSDMAAQVGLQVRTRTVTLSSLSPEVQQAVKAYDARLARVEIHRAEFDTDTGNLIEAPERVGKGWLGRVVWSRGRDGNEATCTLTIESAARALTRALTQKYSDASQRLVDPSDAFFRYVDVAPTASVWWGEKRHEATPANSVVTPRGRFL